MKVLTANRLGDGIAVWLGADLCWREHLAEAEVAASDQSVAALERAGEAAMAGNQVLDAILIDVERVGDSIVPVRLRERIRAAGPSVRTDLGKQAERGQGRVNK